MDVLTPRARNESIAYYCPSCDLYILRGNVRRHPLIICRECAQYAGIVDAKKFKESAATYKMKKLYAAEERRKHNKKVAEEYKLKPKDKPKKPPVQGPAGDFDD